jgi:hypothetical protein
MRRKRRTRVLPGAPPSEKFLHNKKVLNKQWQKHPHPCVDVQKYFRKYYYITMNITNKVTQTVSLLDPKFYILNPLNNGSTDKCVRNHDMEEHCTIQLVKQLKEKKRISYSYPAKKKEKKERLSSCLHNHTQFFMYTGFYFWEITHDASLGYFLANSYTHGQSG